MLLNLNIFTSFSPISFIYKCETRFKHLQFYWLKVPCFLYSYTRVEIRRDCQNVCWSLAQKEWDSKGNTENPSNRALYHTVPISTANMECVFPFLFHSTFSRFLVGVVPTTKVPRYITGFFAFGNGNFSSNIIFRFSQSMLAVEKICVSMHPTNNTGKELGQEM